MEPAESKEGLQEVLSQPASAALRHRIDKILR